MMLKVELDEDVFWNAIKHAFAEQLGTTVEAISGLGLRLENQPSRDNPKKLRSATLAYCIYDPKKNARSGSPPYR